MKKRNAKIAAAAVCAVLLVFLAGPVSAQEKISDRDVASAVDAALFMDEFVPSDRINVSCHQGVVTLKGSVKNILEKERADETAQRIRGVRSVINQIKVKPGDISDTKIKNNVVNSLLRDPAADSYEVNVSVNNGEVKLTGTVDSMAEKNLAEKVAKGVRGVTALKNNIDVRVKENRPDYEIEKEVKKRLQTSLYVDAGMIDVDVSGGDVKLKGAVGSLAEKTRAHNLSWVAGVKSVDSSGLNVSWWEENRMKRKDKMVTKKDSEIEKAVKDAFLYDPRVFSFKINVDSNNGLVRLTGRVDNHRAKKAAEKDAENTSGVWAVNNMIKVRPKKLPSDYKVGARIKSALNTDPLLYGYDIDTNVYNNKVYLYGTVDNYYEKEHAENIVSATKGVVAVDNNLKARDHTVSLREAELEHKISKRYFWSAMVDETDIGVSVDDDTVTLKGEVADVSELNEAIRMAFNAGADEVKNRLKVENLEDEKVFFGMVENAFYP